MNRNSYNHSIILIRLNIRVLIRRARYTLPLPLFLSYEKRIVMIIDSRILLSESLFLRVSARAVKTINYKLTSLHRSTIIKYARMNFLDHIPPIRFHSILYNVIITSRLCFNAVMCIVIILRR